MKKAAEAFEILQKPFLPEEIEWRVGRKSKDGSKGTALAYMDARAVRKRFNEAVGPENWELTYQPIDMGVSSKLDKFGNAVDYKGFIATITIRVLDEDGNVITVSRSDGSELTDFQHIKGGLSGAEKRVASQFGVGDYLYGLKEEWVPLDKYGNILKHPVLPQWALPKGYEQPLSNINTEALNNYADIDDFGASEFEKEESSSDDVIMPFGKMKGQKIKEMTDTGYLAWIVDKSSCYDNVKQAARERLEELGE
ncbi:Rad52/Rad22 family DNA repair protein [Veillonella seminalis]|uniref:Rad52/Rad22 family DNA repair protein n=1 Tax=Veillonella seminalis TaxID=1502943 RepID=UPI00402A8E9F